jgi:hypothetical protein
MWAGLMRAAEGWAGRKPGLLVSFDLADAQRLLRDYRAQLSPAIIGYIELSVADDRRVRTRASRLAFGVAAAMAVLAASALVFQQIAHARLQESLIAQSRFLSKTAEDYLRSGDAELALSAALAALPSSGRPRPLAPDALNVLKEVLAWRYVVGAVLAVVGLAVLTTQGVGGYGALGLNVWALALALGGVALIASRIGAARPSTAAHESDPV